ncbi:MAPEG family protein [Pelagibacterium sp.]|uniref:MAPEG family protein n=1 Tax=Pelagibacterium sp. TaxID=1967288 RepID=UPI003BACB092
MLPITSLAGAILAFMLVALSISVSLKRMDVGTHIGMGEDVGLLRRIRAQGNFIEYVPIALILCALAEYRGAAAAWLWMLSGLLLVGRVVHATGILSGIAPVRAAGMVATYAAILTGALAQFLA